MKSQILAIAAGFAKAATIAASAAIVVAGFMILDPEVKPDPLFAPARHAAMASRVATIGRQGIGTASADVLPVIGAGHFDHLDHLDQIAELLARN